MSAPLARTLTVSRSLNPKTDPINGHKGVDLGNGEAQPRRPRSGRREDDERIVSFHHT